MSVIPDMQNQTSTLREEAALRFAQSLSDRYTAEDRRALDAWLAADQAHVRAFNDARKTWKAMQALQNDAELLALASEPVPQARRVTPPRRWLALAASFATVAIGAALWWQQMGGQGIERFETRAGEQRSVSFADGSSALLSGNTAIEVSMSEGEAGNGRRATVQRGEAVFDIVTDKTRPFVVQAADARVIVTGTRFQVRNHDGQVHVTLVEGVVHLERQRYQYEQKLEPGEQVAFVADKPQAQKKKVDAQAVTTWRRDQLVFRDVPLSEALREANRHATLKLVLEDDSLEDILVNGHFRVGDTESLLAAVQTSFPLHIRREGQQVILARTP